MIRSQGGGRETEVAEQADNRLYKKITSVQSTGKTFRTPIARQTDFGPTH